MIDNLFELSPTKRFLIQTDACDYWADDFVVHKQPMTDVVSYISVIYEREDGHCVVCDIHSPIGAVLDFGAEFTLESFRETVDRTLDEIEQAQKEFIEHAKKKDSTVLTQPAVSGYQ